MDSRFTTSSTNRLAALSTILICCLSEIERIPSFRFSSNTAKETNVKCVVCISEYANREKLRRLPCSHDFHAKCIDKWLKVGTIKESYFLRNVLFDHLLYVWLKIVLMCIYTTRDIKCIQRSTHWTVLRIFFGHKDWIITIDILY